MSTHLRVNVTDWISQSEAGRLRGVSRQAIFRLIQRGRLRTLRIAGRDLVNRNEVLGMAPLPAGRRKRKRQQKGSR